MNTHRMNAAAGALRMAMQRGAATPEELAYDLEAAQLLQSPESAAELARLREAGPLALVNDEELAQIASRREEAMDVSALASWPLAEYHLMRQALKDSALLLGEISRLRARVAQLDADRYAEVSAWLYKKAREYGSTRNREHAAQAEVLERMASKVARGAIRPAEDPHDSPLHHDYRIGRELPEVPRG